MNALVYCVPHPHIIKKCKKQIITDNKNTYYIYSNELNNKSNAIKYFNSLFCKEFKLDNIIFKKFTYTELGIYIPSYLTCTGIHIKYAEKKQKEKKQKVLKKDLDKELDEIHIAINSGKCSGTIINDIITNDIMCDSVIVGIL